MTIAFDTARWVVRRFGVCPPVTEDQVDSVIGELGLRLKDAPLTLTVPAFRADYTIAIRQNLSSGERLWLKAHELGHYLLHAGDQTQSTGGCGLTHQERQAETFAGWLLLGNGWRKMPAWQVAEEWQLPECRVTAWLAERERELG